MHYPHTAYRSESHLSSALYPVYQAHGDSEITDHKHTQLKQVTSLTEYESRDLCQVYQPRYASTLDHQRQFLGYGRPIIVGAPTVSILEPPVRSFPTQDHALAWQYYVGELTITWICYLRSKSINTVLDVILIDL